MSAPPAEGRSNVTNITEAQAERLFRAAEPEGAIEAESDAKLATALIRKGLAISRQLEDGSSRLVITAAGRAAIAPQTGVDEPEGSAGDRADRAGDVPGEQSPPAEEAWPTGQAAIDDGPKGKLGVLVGLLKRPEGARVGEMVAATGWQAHSVRGAMSGALKKKLGLTIESEKTGAGRVYRIPAEARA
jgi:hypothetical protein